jgi:PilZ domain
MFPAMEERRQFPRHIAMKSGRIRFHGTVGCVDCVVRDISAGGAQLELPAVSGIPSEFRLALDGTPVRDCFVKWRTPQRLGVAFLPSHAAALHS